MRKTFLRVQNNARRRPDSLLLVGILIASFLAIGISTAAQSQRPSTPADVFNQYCVTCHNPRTKTAGLVIDPAELSRVGANPELWEKVVRKLRSEAMPPPGSPRPDAKTYDATAVFLESELDRTFA